MASHPTSIKVARWPAYAFLIWNLIGIATFFMQWTADLDELAKTDPYQAKIFAEMPTWAWISFAIGVLAGTASAIALVLLRKAAILLSVVEIIAIVAQFGYTFLGTDLLAVRGWITALFPAIILAIAIIQLLYGLSLQRKGVLR